MLTDIWRILFGCIIYVFQIIIHSPYLSALECALCSAKCALCSGVRSDLSARFKRPRKNKLMLRVSLKLLKNWRNAGKCASEPVCPYRVSNLKIWFQSEKVSSCLKIYSKHGSYGVVHGHVFMFIRLNTRTLNNSARSTFEIIF